LTTPARRRNPTRTPVAPVASLAGAVRWLGRLGVGALVAGCTTTPVEQDWWPAPVEPPPVTGPRDAPPPPEGSLSVDIVVKVLKPQSHTVNIDQTWYGVTGPLRFKRHGDDSYGIQQVRLSVDGNEKRIHRNGRIFTPKPAIDDHATVSYRVRPGGEGKLGHQGFVDEQMVVVDGRAWLLPVSRQPLASARIKFEMPEGWSVASSLQPEADGWYRFPDGLTPEQLLHRLTTDCLAAGFFTATTSEVGPGEVRSFTHRELKPGFSTYLTESTTELAQWFHDELGVATEHPRAFVRTSARTHPVYGGTGLGGVCFEGRAADTKIRNAQLLARRMVRPWLAEALFPADGSELWWRESLPRYLELGAVEATGALEPGLVGPDLWQAHQKATLNRPVWASTPLSTASVVDNPTRTYLHDTRGPLVLHALASLVRQRTDTTLEAVLKQTITEGRRRPVRLQELVTTHTGTSFDDLFAAYVEGGLPLVPLVPGLITDWARDRARRPMTATTSGYPIPDDYIAWQGASGRYGSFDELLDHLGEEGPVRNALADRGVRLLEGEALETLGGIDSRTRHDLTTAEARWPVHLAGKPALGKVTPQLTLGQTPAAEQLRTLRAADRAYEASLGQGPVESITVRRGAKKGADKQPDVLVVPPGEPFTIYLYHHHIPSALSVELWSDGERHYGLPITMEPGWVRNRLEIGVADRPATPGVFTVKVLDSDGQLLGERSFWQQPIP